MNAVIVTIPRMAPSRPSAGTALIKSLLTAHNYSNRLLDINIDFFNTFEEFNTNVDEIEKIKIGCFDYSFNSFLKNIAVFYNFSLLSLDSFENSFRKFIESLYLKIII